MTRRIFLILLFLAICNLTFAQYQHAWEEYYEDLMQMENESVTLNEDTYDLLCELEAHPMNINTATREDLEQLPFLNQQQVEDIQAYVYQYRGMKSLGELAMIESLDRTRCQLLKHFLYAEEVKENKHFPVFKNIFKYGKHRLIATASLPFYKREGDRNGYLGYQYAHSFRYKFYYGNYLQIGLVGAQDAGEPLFTNGNTTGYDHYSFYAIARKLGKIKTLAVGRYKLSFGQGLVMNSCLGFGKLSYIENSERTSNVIRAYSSRSQADYLQGAAATIELTKHIDISAFASYRKIDATLTKEGGIQTILKSGYHRTPVEMMKKNNTSEMVFGGNLQGHWNGLRLGFSGIYTHFDRPLMPRKTRKYKKFAPEGYNFWNMSMNYGCLKPKWNLNGEVAIGKKGGVAMINSLSIKVKNDLILNSIQRYYSHKYNSFFSRGFSSGGHIQNELGVLLGMNWKVSRRLGIKTYSDFAYFPKPTFFALQASCAWDNYIMATYKVGEMGLSVRYRIKIRTNNHKGKTSVGNDYMHRGRFSWTYKTEKWGAKTQIDMALNYFEKQSFGFMVSESGMWQAKTWLKIAGNLGYFRTDDYKSRLYCYEPNVLYAFSFPSYEGEGMRIVGFTQASINEKLILAAKIGCTKYFNRNSISSGLQRINNSVKTDLEVQLRWKF